MRLLRIGFAGRSRGGPGLHLGDTEDPPARSWLIRMQMSWKAWPGIEKCRDGAPGGAGPSPKGPTPKGVKTKMVRGSALRPLGLCPKGKEVKAIPAPDRFRERFGVAVLILRLPRCRPGDGAENHQQRPMNRVSRMLSTVANPKRATGFGRGSLFLASVSILSAVDRECSRGRGPQVPGCGRNGLANGQN
jgi:hypothetical protein